MQSNVLGQLKTKCCGNPKSKVLAGTVRHAEQLKDQLSQSQMNMGPDCVGLDEIELGLDEMGFIKWDKVLKLRSNPQRLDEAKHSPIAPMRAQGFTVAKLAF